MHYFWKTFYDFWRNLFDFIMMNLNGRRIETLHCMKATLEFFLNWAELSMNSVNSVNSGNLKSHWSINRTQYNDPVSHVCLAGTVVAYWSLTQEVAGSRPFTVTNIFVTEFAEFSENLGKTTFFCCSTPQLADKWNAFQLIIHYSKD